MTPTGPSRSWSGERLIQALARHGFVLKSQRGSHVKLTHPDGRLVIVPMHRELKQGTLRSILRQARISLADLV